MFARLEGDGSIGTDAFYLQAVFPFRDHLEGSQQAERDWRSSYGDTEKKRLDESGPTAATVSLRDLDGTVIDIRLAIDHRLNPS